VTDSLASLRALREIIDDVRHQASDPTLTVAQARARFVLLARELDEALDHLLTHEQVRQDQDQQTARQTEVVMVRGKFMVTEITEMAWSKEARKVVLTPQYDNTIEEDRRYAKATPSGRIEMQIDNPSALAALPMGKQFYVDFTPVE
jgi:hypothetical protein